MICERCNSIEGVCSIILSGPTYEEIMYVCPRCLLKIKEVIKHV
jgi:hypothetical protein